jgi:hypothetical protein
MIIGISVGISSFIIILAISYYIYKRLKSSGNEEDL